jgi:hypothetical protein
LKEIVSALGALGGKDARRAMKEFLLTYRADPAYFGDPSPLLAIKREKLALAGQQEQAVDPGLHQELHQHAERAQVQGLGASHGSNRGDHDAVQTLHLSTHDSAPRSFKAASAAHLIGSERAQELA